MKLSFSVKNWDGLSWDELCDAAGCTRLKGIELFDIRSGLFQGKNGPANPERAASVRRNLTSRGLHIPCIEAAADFTSEQFAGEFAACLELAVNLGISYIAIRTEEKDAAVCEKPRGADNEL